MYAQNLCVSMCVCMCVFLCWLRGAELLVYTVKTYTLQYSLLVVNILPRYYRVPEGALNIPICVEKHPSCYSDTCII